MADTIKDVKLIWADKLTPGSLMIDDLIDFDGEIIQVVSINSDAHGDNYFIEYADEYGERDVLDIAHDTYVDLYVYIDVD